MCETLAADHLAGDGREPSAVGDDRQQDGEDDGGGGGGNDARGEQRGVGGDGQDGGRGGHRPQPPHHLDLSPADERTQLRAQGKNFFILALSILRLSLTQRCFSHLKSIVRHSSPRYSSPQTFITSDMNVGQSLKSNTLQTFYECTQCH